MSNTAQISTAIHSGLSNVPTKRTSRDSKLKIVKLLMIFYQERDAVYATKHVGVGALKFMHHAGMDSRELQPVLKLLECQY